METIFSRIIKGEIPCDKVFENERILAFHDIHPVAPVHILVIPKKPIENLQSVSPHDLPLLAEMLSVIQKLADDLKIAEGYRVVVNNGESAGQSVFHLHFHLIAGRSLSHQLG